MRRGIFLAALGLAAAMQGANAFYVTGRVLGGDEARFGTATIVRDLIPGEPAFQLAGPDPLYPQRLLFRPSYGALFLTDAGSQWTSGLAVGQGFLAIAEAVPGAHGWSGGAWVGWSRLVLTKPDYVAGLATFADTPLAAVPAPQLVAADETQVSLSAGPLGLAGVAAYSLWRRDQGSQTWTYLQSLPMPAPGQQAQAVDASVQAGKGYHYGLSAEIPWPGGSGAGARPGASGLFVSQARSDSGLILASQQQAAPPKADAQTPTPVVRADGWEAFPNPATGKQFKVTFRADGPLDYNIIVYLLDGSLARQARGHVDEPGWKQVGVGIEGLGTGIYLVQLRTQNASGAVISHSTKKLAILH